MTISSCLTCLLPENDHYACTILSRFWDRFLILSTFFLILLKYLKNSLHLTSGTDTGQIEGILVYKENFFSLEVWNIVNVKYFAYFKYKVFFKRFGRVRTQDCAKHIILLKPTENCTRILVWNVPKKEVRITSQPSKWLFMQGKHWKFFGGMLQRWS